MIATGEGDNVYVFEAYKFLLSLSAWNCSSRSEFSLLMARRYLDGKRKAYNYDAPVLITQSPSSLTRTHWLASSNSKSWRSSIRFAYSESFLRLRFLFLASHSGSGLAVDEPEIVYTGTADWLLSFILLYHNFDVFRKFGGPFVILSFRHQRNSHQVSFGIFNSALPLFLLSTRYSRSI